ncbi:ribonuclease H-like domain-containing protein [Penicillium malachiteum]|uniref:ribonuclease H n=1 Tax=Penicillium malachiteum TaxID=1324776 RepID=A0AAD6MX93_9EURO|nr:ribonuclease H-like domain-containing protein [Penicillium malachiteum]
MRTYSQSVNKKFTLGRRTFDYLYSGNGCIIPEKFIPVNPNQTPGSYFQPGFEYHSQPGLRFFHRSAPGTFLVYTDGACLNIGTENAKAGCAFVYGQFPRPRPADPVYVRFPLENRGPTGEEHGQTSDRAELRAVIAASRFCDWRREGFDTMVIATDSEYVVKGITTRIQPWILNDWRTETGEPVTNRDLWECLLGEIEQWHVYGMKLQFWQIEESQNTIADHFARLGACESHSDVFHDIRP